MKKLVALVGALVVGCMSLFASGEFGERVCKLDDRVLARVSNDYNFVSECSYKISETCALADGDVFVLFYSENDKIRVYSMSEECSVSATDCIRLVDACASGFGLTLYRL